VDLTSQYKPITTKIFPSQTALKFYLKGFILAQKERFAFCLEMNYFIVRHLTIP
jgi:hypothetical protein